MTERLLQFIWQFQHFNKHELRLTTGEAFRVINPGRFNSNQGPDFLEARIRIGNTLWVGNVEIHVQSSAWHKHSHHHDSNYKNVILHVVWDDDLYFIENCIPVFTMQERVPKLLLNQYNKWMESPAMIACGQSISTVKDITWTAWKERLLVERLERKTKLIAEYLQQNNQHWEETTWWLLARNFGIKINAEAFEAIARSLPLCLLAKHRNHLHQLEALLLGQAGLLEQEFREEYPRLLQREYRFLKIKYSLKPVLQPLHFLRMRPAGFPTIRLAQLAMLIHTSGHLFSVIKEMHHVEAIKKLFSITPSDYWHQHYTFDELSVFRQRTLGDQMTVNIIINTIIPLLFAYGHTRKENSFKEKAMAWMISLPPEKNNLLNEFEELEITNTNAFDSQALLELKNLYCDHKRCLDCAVGNSILRAGARKPAEQPVE